MTAWTRRCGAEDLRAWCHKVVTKSKNRLCCASRRPARSIAGKPPEDPCAARALSFVGGCGGHAMNDPFEPDEARRFQRPRDAAGQAPGAGDGGRDPAPERSAARRVDR